jgi:multicomponent K+:H+ antiporter subunit D
VLGGGLLATYGLARAGSSLFWKTHGPVVGGPMPAGERLALGILGVGVVLWVVGAGPASAYTAATAHQLAHPQEYIQAVLRQTPVRSPGGPQR